MVRRDLLKKLRQSAKLEKRPLSRQLEYVIERGLAYESR